MNNGRERLSLAGVIYLWYVVATSETLHIAFCEVTLSQGFANVQPFRNGDMSSVNILDRRSARDLGSVSRVARLGQTLQNYSGRRGA